MAEKAYYVTEEGLAALQAELEDLLHHIDIHGGYPRAGYQQMTTRQKWIFSSCAKAGADKEQN